MENTKKKVSLKVNGKWWTFGSLKTNQYGNLQLSFKNTPELKKLILEGGEWINFSLFDDEGERKLKPETQAKLDDLKSTAFNDEEIPF